MCQSIDLYKHKSGTAAKKNIQNQSKSFKHKKITTKVDSGEKENVNIFDVFLAPGSCGTQDSFLQFIREKGRITGKLHLVLRDGRHFLESEDATLLTHLCDAVRGCQRGGRGQGLCGLYILSSGKFPKHGEI